jgi:large subunit ribosomal protein L34e
MVSGRHKSRSMRRVYVRTPGGRNVVHYRKRKPKKKRCSGCGKILSGVLSDRPYKMRNTAKTKKRPSRAYGGVLCSRCSREKIKERVR